MHAHHTACAIAALTCALVAQGTGRGGSRIRTLAPRYPTDHAFHEFAPFTDTSGKALRTSAVAAGVADIDGDENPDLWFLGDGARSGEVAVQFANTAGLGRFYRREGLAQSNYIHATTYRTKSATLDYLLVVDPQKDQPVLLHWNPRKPKGDPRDGYLGGSDSGWVTGKNIREIQTAEHRGDGHDDIIVLRDISPQPTRPITRISLLEMGTQRYSFLWVENTLSVEVPARLERLRLLDLDGDQRTDFVAVAPGIGLVAYRQRAGGFDLHGFWPTGGFTIRDVTTADFDGNGRDDIAVCFDTAIVTIQHHSPGHQRFPNGFEYRAFVNPTSVGPLHTCRIIDADGVGSKLLIGLPRDGRNFVIHAHNPAAYGLIGPWVEAAPATLTGPGVTGESVVIADVDNDHDPDLVVQSPSGTHWLTLRNPAVSFAPTGLFTADLGPVPNEGTQFDVNVTVPQALIAEGVLFLEVGLYVVDPTSPNQNDPEYLYWGRLVPPINSATNEASFSVYYWDQSLFDTQVAEFKKNRHINGGAAYVYPKNKWETIRGGPGMFMTIHGVDSTKRYESKNGNPKPKKSGSTLGGKWILKAKPPSLKGDVELLPWE